MQCIILCAGFATRLRPLTLNCPKHLLPIAGRPMLDYVLDKLAESGIESGVLITNNKFSSQFERWYAEGEHALNLRIVNDGTDTNETRLGAIGDLRFALEAANVCDDFVVVNGDNLFTFSADGPLGTFRERGNTIVVYDVGSFEVAKLMGYAQADGSGRVTGFIEKPQNPPETTISIGIYVFESGVRALVKRYLDEGNPGDRTGDFIAWLHRQTPVYIHSVSQEDGVWFDIGSWEQYQEANAAYGGEPVPMPSDATDDSD